MRWAIFYTSAISHHMFTDISDYPWLWYVVRSFKNGCLPYLFQQKHHSFTRAEIKFNSFLNPLSLFYIKKWKFIWNSTETPPALLGVFIYSQKLSWELFLNINIRISLSIFCLLSIKRQSAHNSMGCIWQGIWYTGGARYRSGLRSSALPFYPKNSL